MDASAVDFPPLFVGVAVAAMITGSLVLAARGDGWRRVLAVSAILALVLGTIGFIDLMRERPRETHVATVVLGVLMPVLGAAALQRGVRRARPWIRWPLVFVTAFILLFAGLLIGAAIVPRLLG